MPFGKPERDVARLKGVHPDLVAVVKRAAEICPATFIVVQGTRTLAEQRENVRKGASKTMRSRHIPAANGYGHAVDLVIVEGGEAMWKKGGVVAKAMKQAAAELEIQIEWGGDWTSFKDQPHFQLPWGAYPGSKPLSKSRTIIGASSAGTFGLLADPVSQAAQQIQPLAEYSAGIKWLFIGLMLAGAGLAIYAKWDESQRDKH